MARNAFMYYHQQTTPSLVWIINHNLNRQRIVDIVVEIDNRLDKILPNRIIHTSLNQTQVHFTIPFQGTATLR